MNIPTINECNTLIEKMNMMDHIVAHSVQVCRVASLLADHLLKHQPHLNPDLVRAGAILHDITKTRSFDTGENHAVTGEITLRELNFPEVGDIIGQHVTLKAYFSSSLIDEAEIVNYADKRVLHDKIVSLNNRMVYILERYGGSPAHRVKLSWLWEKSKLMEKRLFKDLPFSPDQVETLLDGAGGYEILKK
jgi:putative nucleotidyltransferase with HDIG domain